MTGLYPGHDILLVSAVCPVNVSPGYQWARFVRTNPLKSEKPRIHSECGWKRMVFIYRIDTPHDVCIDIWVDKGCIGLFMVGWDGRRSVVHFLRVNLCTVGVEWVRWHGNWCFPYRFVRSPRNLGCFFGEPPKPQGKGTTTQPQPQHHSNSSKRNNIKEPQQHQQLLLDTINDKFTATQEIQKDIFVGSSLERKDWETREKSKREVEWSSSRAACADFFFFSHFYFGHSFPFLFLLVAVVCFRDMV